MLTQEEYQKLALQQYVHYQTQMDEYLALEEELEELRAKISARHKKHRRCDKEIHKSYKCGDCQKNYASDIALKLHLKLKHKGDEKISASCTEDSHGAADQSCSQLLGVFVVKNE